MIVAVLGYTALDSSLGDAVVRKSFLLLALWLSTFYLVLVFLTIAIQPFTATNPLDLMKMSNLWLGPLQGVVASALGVLFVTKRPTRGELETQ